MRKIIAAAALSIASLFVVAGPASALSPGGTVCYTADGTPVVNPPNPDDYDFCATNPGSGGSGGGGGGGPVLCTVDVYSGGYNDGLGSTGPYTVRSCSPIMPFQG